MERDTHNKQSSILSEQDVKNLAKGEGSVKQCQNGVTQRNIHTLTPEEFVEVGCLCDN